MDPWLALTEFSESKRPGCWRGLRKVDILLDIEARLRQPFLVRQGGQPFCGPAAVVFESIRRDPVRYVGVCRSLWEDGCIPGYSRNLVASERLRRSRGNFRMPAADWMVLATLRDTTNSILPVHPGLPQLFRNLSGITLPGEIGFWLKELLGVKSTKFHQAAIGDTMANLTRAKETIAAGGIAIALINDGLLHGKLPIVPFPNHWVAIVDRVERADTCVDLDLYSWGLQMSCQLTPATAVHWWGIVTGELV
jgi:hypothetical protein